jgi:uncharacterized protein
MRPVRAIASLVSLSVVLFSANVYAACQGQDLWPVMREKDPARIAAVEAAARAMPFAQGRLFRIEKEGRAPSYLFGTVHTLDPRVMAMTPAAQEALRSARAVAVEVEEAGDLNNPKVIESLGSHALVLFLAKAEERADQILSADMLERFEDAVAKQGLPRSAARTFKPGFLAFSLLVPPCIKDQRDMLDGWIARTAKERGARLVGLESLLEQFEALTDHGPDVQKALTLSVLGNLDNREHMLETVIARYLAGDMGLILAMMEHHGPVAGFDFSLPPRFRKALIDDRNITMAKRALPLIEEGGAFIAVGAAHLPGEMGLARLIEREGYRVTRVD